MYLKMFRQTFSRANLQALPEEQRIQRITNYVEGMYHNVIAAARDGKTSYLHPYVDVHAPQRHQPQHVTVEEAIEGLKLKFPECSISYYEEWVEVRPGIRQQKIGIKIDWS